MNNLTFRTISQVFYPWIQLEVKRKLRGNLIILKLYSSVNICVAIQYIAGYFGYQLTIRTIKLFTITRILNCWADITDGAKILVSKPPHHVNKEYNWTQRFD